MNATWDISSVEFDRKSGRMFYGIRMSPDMIGARAYKLIAAAPDLLEALRQIHSYTDVEHFTNAGGPAKAKRNIRQIAESAITKAEG